VRNAPLNSGQCAALNGLSASNHGNSSRGDAPALGQTPGPAARHQTAVIRQHPEQQSFFASSIIESTNPRRPMPRRGGGRPN